MFFLTFTLVLNQLFVFSTIILEVNKTQNQDKIKLNVTSSLFQIFFLVYEIKSIS